MIYFNLKTHLNYTKNFVFKKKKLKKKDRNT